MKIFEYLKVPLILILFFVLGIFASQILIGFFKPKSPTIATVNYTPIEQIEIPDHLHYEDLIKQNELYSNLPEQIVLPNYTPTEDLKPLEIPIPNFPTTLEPSKPELQPEPIKELPYRLWKSKNGFSVYGQLFTVQSNNVVRIKYKRDNEERMCWIMKDELSNEDLKYLESL